MERQQVIESYRRAEFIPLSSALFLWAGIGLMIACGFIVDYNLWGWRWFWMVDRMLYAPWAIVWIGMYRFPFFKKHYTVPPLVCAAYIWVALMYLIARSGWGVSPFIHGHAQLLIAMSVLPFRRATYAAVWVSIALVPLGFYIAQSGGFAFYPNSHFSHAIDYLLLAALVFWFTDRLREQTYESRYRLSEERANQARTIALQSEKIAEARVAVTVCKATQMLAHDVRKPFSILRVGLQALRGLTDPAEVRGLSDQLIPDVESAVNSVENLVAEIMHIDASGELNVDSRRPERIIETAVREVLRQRPDIETRFEYRLSHTREVMVDEPKVHRVFSNILFNAIQAMDGRGRIWFETEPVTGGKPFVRFCVGNDGPSIAAEDLPKLFNSFFTKNKINGTGLGLAIAHGVVTAHGGRIWATSEPGQGVRFHFTLPAGERACVPDIREMPTRAHTSSVVRVVTESCRQRADAIPAPSNLPKVVVLDDDRSVLEAMRAALRQTADVAAFASPELFWEAVRNDRVDLSRLTAVITDFSFDTGSATGLTLAKRLRKECDAPVILLSNGSFAGTRVSEVFAAVIDKTRLNLKELDGIIRGAARQVAGRSVIPTSASPIVLHPGRLT